MSSVRCAGQASSRALGGGLATRRGPRRSLGRVRSKGQALWSKSRHSINLPSDFVRDSAFPFKVGEELTTRIESGKIIIEKNPS